MPASLSLDGAELEVVAVKIGGSSLTEKAHKETIDAQALEWFSKTVAEAVDEGYTFEEDAKDGPPPKKHRLAYVIVHGAGSFGHHTAKEYGLKGRFQPPPADQQQEPPSKRRRTMRGVAATRESVQKLNRILVSSLIQHGVNAVSISPGFALAQAHGFQTDQGRQHFRKLLVDTLQAGLVPVLHGDACLWGVGSAGILSGDVLMEEIGKLPWVSQTVFLTDVEGVFTADPRSHPQAKLLPRIEIDAQTQEVIAPVLEVSESSHGHDVTGGFKTKLGSAATIAASGTNVTIVKCCSKSGKQAMLLEQDIERATVVYSKGTPS